MRDIDPKKGFHQSLMKDIIIFGATGKNDTNLKRPFQNPPVRQVNIIGNRVLFRENIGALSAKQSGLQNRNTAQKLAS